MIFSNKNMYHPILLKGPMTVFIHLLQCLYVKIYFTWFVSGLQIDMLKKDNEKKYMIWKWKIVIRLTILTGIDSGMKMFCNYGAKMMALSSKEIYIA